MSLFDVFLAFIIAFCAWFGAKRGLWRVLYWAAGFAGTMFLSIYFYDTLYGAFRFSFRRGAASFLVYIILFSGVGIVLWILWRPFERWIVKNRLMAANQAMGFFAGLGAGVILAGFASLLALRAAGGELRTSVQSSALAPVLLKPAELVSFLLPARFRAALGTGPARS